MTSPHIYRSPIPNPDPLFTSTGYLEIIAGQYQVEYTPPPPSVEELKGTLSL